MTVLTFPRGTVLSCALTWCYGPYRQAFARYEGGGEFEAITIMQVVRPDASSDASVKVKLRFLYPIA